MRNIPTILSLAYEGDTPPANEPPPADDKKEKIFKQDDVNRLLAEERRKVQQSSQKLVGELEALKQKANLTQQERDELSSRIESLQSEYMTKEELSKRQLDKAKKEADERIAALENGVKTWQSKYTTTTIKRTITDAAVSNDAYNAGQVVAILERDAMLVDVLDEDQKPTGEHEVKVKFNDVDKSGKDVTLTLTPAEAVKRMKEIEGYQNLFKGTGTGGVGGTTRGSGKQLDAAQLAKTNPEEYRRLRKEGKITL
jgi:chromosome segregation ATPase